MTILILLGCMAYALRQHSLSIIRYRPRFLQFLGDSVQLHGFCQSQFQIVRDMAGKNPQQTIADFDLHYIPDGAQEPEASVGGNADENRSSVKLEAEGICRSLSKSFVFLTYNTSSPS